MRRFVLLAAVGVALAACGEGGDDGPPVASADVTAVDDRFEPDRLEVPAGQVEFTVVNDGRVFHTFVIAGIGFKFQLDSGEEKTAVARLEEPGELFYYCDVEGHREDGMEGVLTIREPADPSR